MDWTRRLWFALAVVGVLGAVAVFLGAMYGGAGVAVESVAASAETPTNASANCDAVVVRNVDVTVSLSRAGIGRQNPQWWQVGLTVRASVFDGVKQRVVTLGPGAQRSVTIPFTDVRKESWAPHRTVQVVVQVTKGNAELAERTTTVELVPVKAGRHC